jgi:hypothetical protein
VINVSNDGKYFASINEGEAYLKVWDLETMEVIRNVQLYDESTSDNWCEPKDIQFSKLNNDMIYYSGKFPNKKIFALTKYNVIDNKIINNYFEFNSPGVFLLFNSENYVIRLQGINILIGNLTTNEAEKSIKGTIEIPLGKNLIFTDELFLGSSSNLIGAIRFDNQSVINSTNQKEIIISPNPTTNTININLNSNGFEYIRLSIVDLLGNEVGFIEEGLMNTSSYQKEYDVSDLPPSMYFIRLEIGKEVVTKQFIKE